MQYVADLHLHSPYSRAVSPQMTLPVMASIAVKKGLTLLSAADWTHPKWLSEIQEQLQEVDEGIYGLKEGTEKEKEIGFILGSEISSIYKQGDKLRRIHNLVFVPDFVTAERIRKELEKRGCNLNADGRPIVGLSSHNLLEMVLGINERAFLIPAHVWTPHFGVYGSASGFNSLGEAFGDLAEYIYGVETGLSSDPQMNWQIPELAERSVLSFSDAHSPAKMGRELTILELEKRTFANITAAINRKSSAQRTNYVAYTVEFYPEEGKYHYSGHRACNVSRGPQEVRAQGDTCPVCRRRLTEGVFFRLQHLAGKKELSQAVTEKTDYELLWHSDPLKVHPPYVKLVPLLEIIAEIEGVGVGSKKVQKRYQEIIDNFTELDVLVGTSIDDLAQKLGQNIAEAIAKVRRGDIVIKPGFDGEYGVVKIWSEEEKKVQPENVPQLRIDF